MRFLIIYTGIMLLVISCTSKRDKAMTFNNSGIKKMFEYKLEEAMKDFDNAIAADPEFDHPYFYRANMKFSLGDTKGAISDYTMAITLNPGFKSAYANRGDAYSSINIQDSACNDWKKAQELGKANLEEKLRRCK